MLGPFELRGDLFIIKLLLVDHLLQLDDLVYGREIALLEILHRLYLLV